MLGFMLLIIVGFLLITWADNLQVNYKPTCTQHKWVWKKQPGMEEVEYMQCEVCGKFPGKEESQ